jgi:hypothetical protein
MLLLTRRQSRCDNLLHETTHHGACTSTARNDILKLPLNISKLYVEQAQFPASQPIVPPVLASNSCVSPVLAENFAQAADSSTPRGGNNILDSSSGICDPLYMASEPKTLTQAIRYFADADNCLNYLSARRWPNGVVCPTCGRADVAFVPSRRLWQCKTRHPKAQFSIKTGTILEDSPLGLDKWLPVMWMVANCKNGVSSWEVHRALGVTQKTAWFMLHRIRLGMKTEPNGKFGGSGSEIEADETFVGGKAEFQHKSRKIRIQAARATIRNEDAGGKTGKAAVMGILDREARQVRARVIPNVRREVLQAEILKHVSPGSAIFTDQAGGYQYMPKEFLHEFVDHEIAYVRGRVHTNGLENFWSLLKRSLKGTYVAVEPFHLDRYVDEQVFRYNNRATKDNPLNDSDRFDLLCSEIVGKRLTYAELIDKNGKKPEATSGF